MPEAKIFLVNPTKKELTPMAETTYATEADLQAYLAHYPDLLPGDQIDPETPRRWLLVSREMGVPGEAAEPDRWSVDHLFLDQDGIPTFVECKRSTDTRSRREVVAQMLDYAANGTHYWPMERLRQAATETADAEQTSLDAKVQTLLGPDNEENETAIESYWQMVEQKLRAGQVRLIFVADDIPKELRRLVEFLNEKMADVEVLAVEIKQFLSQTGQTVLVPRVVGLTEAGRIRKTTSRANRQTNRAEFLAHFDPPIADFFEAVVDKAAIHNYTVYWGQKGFSVRAVLLGSNRLASFAYGWPDHTFDLHFDPLLFDDEKRDTLHQKLLALGIFQVAGQTGKTLRAKIVDNQDLTPFYQAYELMLEQVEQSLKQP